MILPALRLKLSVKATTLLIVPSLVHYATAIKRLWFPPKRHLLARGVLAV